MLRCVAPRTRTQADFACTRAGTPLAHEARMSLVTGSDSRPSRPGVKLTYDDFVLFPDDGKRHELIDGEHYVTPSPNLKHQAVSRNLLGLIWTYLRQHSVGKVYAAPLDVVFSHFDVVEPDILY